MNIPNYLFHIVPKNLFEEFCDIKGIYDCRDSPKWGKNLSFIHATPNRKILKNRVADINWINHPLNDLFLLLTIDTSKLNLKITDTQVNGNTYFHIWGPLPKSSYTTIEISRDKFGAFLL